MNVKKVIMNVHTIVSTLKAVITVAVDQVIIQLEIRSNAVKVSAHYIKLNKLLNFTCSYYKHWLIF